MKKNKRLYTRADAYMIETASALQRIFSINIADFTALDATLDSSYAAVWLEQIETAYTLQQHSQLKDILAQKNEDVKNIMANCRTKYKEVKFFAAKAFDNKTKYLEAFGTKQFADARLRPNYMIAFMDELDTACIKYGTELIAAGMSQTSLDEIASLRDNLFEEHTAQETCAREHVIKTEQRIALLNQCFLTMREVMDAAMLIYEHDYARRKAFIFTPSKVNRLDNAA